MPLDVQVDGQTYLLRPIAQKRGLIALALRSQALPPYVRRRKIETQVAIWRDSPPEISASDGRSLPRI